MSDVNSSLDNLITALETIKELKRSLPDLISTGIKDILLEFGEVDDDGNHYISLQNKVKVFNAQKNRHTYITNIILKGNYIILDNDYISLYDQRNDKKFVIYQDLLEMFGISGAEKLSHHFV